MFYIKKLFKLASAKISNIGTLQLTSVIFGLGVLLAAIFWISGRPENRIIATLEVSLSFFLWGFIGLLFIARKEAPFLFGKIKGLPAILFGIFLTIILWSTAFAAIINSLH